MQIITTTIDNSADVFLDTNSRSRYSLYPTRITCNQSLPTFTADCKTCKSDPNYCHPFASNSLISTQFILGNYEFTDVTAAKVQILDKDENIIKESDYIALTNNIEIVANEWSEDEGLRLSLVFTPSNFTEECFWIRGLFTISGIDFTFTSQKYCRKNCTSILKLESLYRDFGKDCLGAYYDGTYQNVYYIDADIEKSEFTFNDVAYNSKGQKTYAEVYDVYTIKCVVNEVAAEIIANILKGTEITVNDESYFNQRLIEKNNVANGMWVLEIELFQRCVPDIKRCN